ncbi:MAG: efflux RND transporter periplasmic adaptor subunit [Vicinamibacterales bacterium]
MNRRNVLIAGGLLVLVAAGAGAAFYLRRERPVEVTTATIAKRDLQALVSASGKIQPRRLVNISSDTSGRVVDLAVVEGQRVEQGQFLLQIDPRTLRTRVEGGTASLQAAEASLEQFRQSVETARVQLSQARQNLARQQDLWKQQLTTRETLERTETEVQLAESALLEREKQAAAQAARIEQERATLESARFDLSRVRIESPIDGIVTRRNIQEGETAVIGTMNNPGTVLLTLADMSIIQAEVEVDETNIPYVQLGQRASVVIDALPDTTFDGIVTEIGNSPIQESTAGATSTTARQATNFKVVVEIKSDIPEVRPGFTCTADITTAVRPGVTAVPIQAVAVRELIYDAEGQIVPPPPADERRSGDTGTAAATELEPGQTREETEGVFVIRDGRAVFVPIELGIAGEEYFEVTEGLRPGDEVITGPYNSVRNLVDGDQVVVQEPARN